MWGIVIVMLEASQEKMTKLARSCVHGRLQSRGTGTIMNPRKEEVKVVCALPGGIRCGKMSN